MPHPTKAERNAAPRTDPAPPLDRRFVEWLRSRNPLTRPDLMSTERELFFAAGRQSLLEQLESIVRHQEEEPL